MQDLKRHSTILVILLLVTLLLTGCIGGGTSKPTYSVSGKVIDGEGVGIPEVTLGFSGDFGIATTDNDGQWSKEGLDGTVTITPAKDGWSFESRQVTKTDSKVNFTGTKKAYPLTVLTTGEGTVNEEIVVAPTQSTEYEHGTRVQLTAVPETGWLFSHWESDLEGSTNPATIVVDSEKAVTAVFIKKEYTLDITVEGQGRVNEEDLASILSTKHEYGTQVKLTAIPEIGWSFSHWGGDLKGAKNPVVVEINNDMAITVTFVEAAYTLDVDVDGRGTISVEQDQESYEYGAKVTLFAVPEEGWTFAHWTGDLSGSSNPATITMSKNSNITAVFTFSIQNAIDNANDGDIIVVPQGEYLESLDFRGKSITLQSSDPNDPEVVRSTVLDGRDFGNIRPVIRIANGESNAEINGFTIKNGKRGVFIGEWCSVIITNCLISNNEVQGDGGGIYVMENASAIIRGNTITNNKAENGGGLYLGNATCLIKNNVIEYNEATMTKGGGGICISGGLHEVVGNTIMNNQSDFRGGGIACDNGTHLFKDNLILGNSSRYGYGAGLHMRDSNSEVINNSITDNNGTGVMVTEFFSLYKYNYTIQGNNISRNRQKGLEVQGVDHVVINGNIFDENNGGAISVDGVYQEIFNNEFIGNRSARGGAIKFEEGAIAKMVGNIFSDNMAEEYGGAVYVSYGAKVTDDFGIVLPSPDNINSYSGNYPDDVFYE